MFVEPKSFLFFDNLNFKMLKFGALLISSATTAYAGIIGPTPDMGHHHDKLVQNESYQFSHQEFVESINGWGYYNYESHQVETQDGQILTVFRVLPKIAMDHHSWGTP